MLSAPLELLTVEELAAKLKVSKHTIYYWAARREIPYLKIGKHLRFRFEHVLKHLDKTEPRLPDTCDAKQRELWPISARGSLKTEDAGHVDLRRKE